MKWIVSKSTSRTLQVIIFHYSVEIYKLLSSNYNKSPVSSTCFLVIKYEQVQCSNGFYEFDSHTTTKIINMKQVIKLMSVYYYTILIVVITVYCMNQ